MWSRMNFFSIHPHTFPPTQQNTVKKVNLHHVKRWDEIREFNESSKRPGNMNINIYNKHFDTTFSF